MAELEDIVNLMQDEPAAETTPVETTPENTDSTPVQAPESAESAPVDTTEFTEVAEETPAATPPQKSVDEIFTEKFREKYGKLPEEYDSEVKELRERPTSTYKTSFGKTFDELLAQNIPAETIVQLGMLDTKTLDDNSALDLELKVQHPHLTNEQRKALIDQRYPTDEATASPTEILAASAQKQIDAATARGNLDKVRGEKLTPADFTDRLNQEKSEQDRVTAWTPKTKEIASSITKIEVPLSFSLHGENGKTENRKFNYGYSLTPTDAAEVEQTVGLIHSELKLAANEQGFNVAKDMALNAFKSKNFDRLMNSAVSRAVSQVYKEVSNRNHNATPPKNNMQQLNSGESSGEDRLMATITHLSQ